MNKAMLLAAAGVAVAAGALAAGYGAGRMSSSPTAAVQQPASAGTETGQIDSAALGGQIREYLLANPELLLEMQQVFELRQREEQRLANLEVIESAREDIFNAAYDGIVGNPNGTTTIVEFYDYNCGYCKRAQQDMMALTEADPDLRFVLKEFPILGPDSTKAHVVSMAFRKLMPDQYAEFHNQLIGGSGRATEATAIRIATSMGVDEATLREEMKNPAIGDAFEKTLDLANRLSITGTPSYVVGNEVVFGALGKDFLAQKIAEVRAENPQSLAN